MTIDWGQLVLPGAILLVVPLAIISAYRFSTGSVVATASLSAGAFAVFWLVLGGFYGFGPGPGISYPVRIAVFYGGILLALATWVLSINAAAHARRWVWVALLAVAGYLTLAGIYGSFSLQYCVSFGPRPDFCPPPDVLTQTLVIAGYLACPVAALVYGIRPSWRRARTLPDGLVASSLRAEHLNDPTDANERSDGSLV